MEGKAMRYSGSLLWITALVISLSSFAATLRAVEAPVKPAEPAKAKEVAPSKDELALKQQQIAEKYRRFDHATNTAVAIPERVNELEVEVGKRGTKQGGHPFLFQFRMPGDEFVQELSNISPVLWWLVASSMSFVADV